MRSFFVFFGCVPGYMQTQIAVYWRTMHARLLSIPVVATAFTAMVAGTTAYADTVLIAVASNFAAPLEPLAAAFEKSSGHVVRSSAGSTGKLFAQIENGGPFDVFLSADATHVEALAKDGFAVEGTRFTYAMGRLSLYAPKLAPVREDALKDARVRHLAIANPDLAPYGAAAMETLKRAGLSDAFKGRLVLGENIAQALQFVDSGAAEAGLVAFSQVKGRTPETYWLVPDDRHAPIRQDACLLRAAKDKQAAKAFLDFLRSDAAIAIIEGCGYAIEKTASGATSAADARH